MKMLTKMKMTPTTGNKYTIRTKLTPLQITILTTVALHIARLRLLVLLRAGYYLRCGCLTPATSLPRTAILTLAAVTKTTRKLPSVWAADTKPIRLPARFMPIQALFKTALKIPMLTKIRLTAKITALRLFPNHICLTPQNATTPTAEPTWWWL